MLVIEESIFVMLQLYAAYEIIFASLMSERGIGESLILDKELNLAGTHSNYLTAL
jgi:hypothetical protein